MKIKNLTLKQCEQIINNNYASIAGESNDRYVNYKDEIDAHYYQLKNKKQEKETNEQLDNCKEAHYFKLITKNLKLFTFFIDTLTDDERIILRNYLEDIFPSMKLPKNLYFNYTTRSIIK
jgi:hypothetical protein